jgi:hypothetical protein
MGVERNRYVGAILRQCGHACDHALTRYMTNLRLSADHALVRDVVSAMAAVATAAEYINADEMRRAVALRLVVDVCRRTARTCRQYGLEADLLACAAACEVAATEAELALESSAA